MLDSETKRKIDSARDILVGKVPDPKAQVEQITTALIYKFMDDMDREAEQLGGVAKFITGELAAYQWANLMSKELGGEGRLILYSAALSAFSKNQHIPDIFRTIFKDAFLPYRDPETLNLFLKEIDYFDYDHSENLGDAFEYLLSVLGSQGDAGQFRTPRHIIDFIVAVLEPKKTDRILDPSCGTAGFLISAYKHIISHEKLSFDERKQLMQHFTGYDISPDMVRLSLVNMYLHSFPTPKIYEYDTLTSEERWQDSFDVILANPPFMTPKGGIRPHKLFSVQANRSEVLFVDYIAEHLSLNGRAGIIVPEGIIFQSANAYKALRKMLVETHLWAVVSLPAGVFQPYSGVKTSILLLDRTIARQGKDVLFIKITNDGFGLGAQRRESNLNDLPTALDILKAYRNSPIRPELDTSSVHPELDSSPVRPELVEGRSYFDKLSTNGGCIAPVHPELDTSPVRPELDSSAVRPELVEGRSYFDKLSTNGSCIAQVVAKTKIAESGDYNLTGDRYRENKTAVNAVYPMVKLGDVCEVLDSLRKPVTKSERKIGEYPYYGATGIVDYVDDYIFNEKLVLIGEDGAKWGIGERTAFIATGKYWVNNHAHVLRPDRKLILDVFLAEIINQMDLMPFITGVTVPKLNQEKLRQIEIPLPPLDIQNAIVAEIEQWQKVIDGAKQVIANYRPTISIKPEWEMVKLGDDKFFQIIDGDRGTNYPSKEEFKTDGYCLFLNTSNVRKGDFDFKKCDFITKEKDDILRKGKLNREDIVLTTRGTLGNTAYYSSNIEFENVRINSGMVLLRSNLTKIFPKFLLVFLSSSEFLNQVSNFMSGSAQPQLPIRVLSEIKIPLPSLETQTTLVEQIEKEQAAIESCKTLIALHQAKIKAKIAEVWGD